MSNSKSTEITAFVLKVVFPLHKNRKNRNQVNLPSNP